MEIRSGALKIHNGRMGTYSGALKIHNGSMGTYSGAPVPDKKSIFRFESLVERNLGSAVKQETPLNERGFLFV